MVSYFFTFSADLAHPFRDHYIEVQIKRFDYVTHADHEMAARNVMFHTFGNKWAFSYTEEQWIDIQEQWNYKPLAIIVEDYPNAPMCTVGGSQ